MHDENKWSRIVHDLQFSWSVYDGEVINTSAGVGALACSLFPCVNGRWPAFNSERALLSHQRIVHKCRSVMRYFVPACGTCPVCGTCFCSHLRLLAHLSDKRRAYCAKEVLARRAGHSNVLASRPAVTAAGNYIEHVKS